MVKPKIKRFKVVYFIGGDEFGRGEKQKCTIIMALSEYEAEYIFKHCGEFDEVSFGWVEEI